MQLILALVLTAFCLAAHAAQPETPLAELPYTPGLDVKAMDRSADPCVDFYQFACGGWLKATPIPGDKPDAIVWSPAAPTVAAAVAVDLKESLREANDAIVDAGKNQPFGRRMGTTAVRRWVTPGVS